MSPILSHAGHETPPLSPRAAPLKPVPVKLERLFKEKQGLLIQAEAQLTQINRIFSSHVHEKGLIEHRIQQIQDLFKYELARHSKYTTDELIAAWGLLVLSGQSTVEVRNELLGQIAQMKSLETEKARHEAKLSHLHIEMAKLSEEGIKISGIITQVQHDIAQLEEVKTRLTT